MERRSFLKGFVSSVGAGTALIAFGKSEGSELLVPQRDVLLAQPDPVPILDPMYATFIGNGLVYVRGEKDYVPIGYLTEFRVHTDPVDATMFSWDGNIRVVSGLNSATAKFEGPLK